MRSGIKEIARDSSPIIIIIPRDYILWKELFSGERKPRTSRRQVNICASGTRNSMKKRRRSSITAENRDDAVIQYNSFYFRATVLGTFAESCEKRLKCNTVRIMFL